MINTYNESSLHKKLKKAAAQKYKGKIEEHIDPYICDVVAEDGTVIEIQTASFKNVQNKLSDLLNTRSVHLIYPLAVQTYIEYYDEDGLASRRKSPKKRCMYNIFDELTGIWPILLNKNFRLEVIEAIVVKKRKKTVLPVQSLNNRRRYKKAWYGFDTDIEQILGSTLFCSGRDYLHVLPENLPENFSSKDVLLHSRYKFLNIRHINAMLWTLHKTELIERTGKKGNKYIYRIKKTRIRIPV
ncbi:hypothetical protein H0R92_07170 [Treponema sp. OMZ 840]|uniref:hypothetical protein n=1 Tax=Treponema sp. OMZ 840 TaxID=244313 RepID=UPI003D8DC9FD